MSKEARQSEEKIKQKIVDGYRRGVCDHEGHTIPKGKRRKAGKGCHFVAPTTDQFRENYDKIVWSN